MKKSFLIVPIIFSLLTVVYGVAHPEVTPEILKQGEAIYKEQCAICHGTEGKGDGRAADFLFPKPRNFTTGSFKVRSTPSGSPPTDQDILHTITNGMPGSAMPGFAYLSETDQRALVAFVKKLAKIKVKPERVIPVSPEPSLTAKTLEEGKRLYKEMKCWECHGFEGRGDGPKAMSQVDDWGFPAPPNNFTKGIYKGGGKLSGIYLRFTTGLDGSPMPSFEDSLTEEERWALVHYVKSLAGPKVAVQPTTGTTLAAKKFSGPLPKDALDPLWDNVPRTTIPLIHLLQGEKGADAVSVQVVHNGRDIAFLIEWEDWEVNSSFLRHDDFADSAAIMFSLSPKEPLSKQPHFTMGEKGGPVNIWYWRFGRQMDPGWFQDIETIYPASGNLPLPIPIRPSRPSAIEDLNAEGFGTLTAQPQQEQNVEGQGIYMSGNWKVVFSREFTSKGQFDVQLKKGGTFPVAFAIWDGSKGDRDGQKAVTTWYVLKLE